MPELQNPITHPALAPIGLEMAREKILDKDEEIRLLTAENQRLRRLVEYLLENEVWPSISAQEAMIALQYDVLKGIRKEAGCGQTQ